MPLPPTGYAHGTSPAAGGDICCCEPAPRPSPGISYPCSFADLAEPPVEQLPVLCEGLIRLRRRISRAIYGEVFLADFREDPSGEARPAAVKRMPREEALRGGRGVESAVGEIQAALAIRRLGAPFVVEVLGAAQDSAYFYLATEFCQGGDLLSWLEREFAVTSEQLLVGMFWQLLAAVRALHREGVAHRDVSLENLLVCSDGSLRLCDLGQALAVHAPGRPEEEAPVARSALGLPGKEEYRAPETHGKSGAYMAKAADLYACGVALFALATGVYPSDAAKVQAGSNDALTLDAQRALLSTYLRSHPGLSPGLVDLVWRLTALEPGERPTAEEATRHQWLAGCALQGDLDVPSAMETDIEQGCGASESEGAEGNALLVT